MNKREFREAVEAYMAHYGQAQDAWLSKYAVVAEVVMPDGSRGLATVSGDASEENLSSWDCMGLLEGLRAQLLQEQQNGAVVRALTDLGREVRMLRDDEDS